MQIEINKENRTSEVLVLEQKGSFYRVSVDDRIYEIDLLMVEEGVWSILHNGNSQIIESVHGDNPKKYFVNTYDNSFEVEIVDSEARYLRSRNKAGAGDAQNQITVPMPGKIVKVLVKEGDPVKSGDTLVIVSAMKMESEYKAEKDGIVIEVHVKEGDTVDGGQIMILLGDE
jgi:biotin carboxyl carrier protein